MLTNDLKGKSSKLIRGALNRTHLENNQKASF